MGARLFRSYDAGLSVRDDRSERKRERWSSAKTWGLVITIRDVDRDLLDYLVEGRVTPAYARDRMKDEGLRDVTSTYLGQRLQRLEEHGHARNLYGTGLYERVEDPREVVDRDGGAR